MQLYKAILVTFIHLILFTFISTDAIGQQKITNTEKNVLVLHSYHQGLEWTDEISKGIQSVFCENSDINIIFEYLDTKRIFTPKYFEALHEIYKIKAEQNNYDVIITCDNAAFDFMRKYSQEYFPGVKVVYCGVNNLDEESLKDLPNFYGFKEEVDYKMTIKSIQSIFPNRKNILIINDNTATAINIKEELIKVLPEFEGELNFEFFTNFDLQDLENKIETLNKTYAIYLLVINSDKHGEFISYKQGISAVKKSSKVPIFGSWSFYSKKGLFGGKITRGFDQGEQAAIMAQEIMDSGISNNISQINSIDSKYVFDYIEMEKFGISKKQIPNKSIILNQADQKERLLKVILKILGVLIILIIFLLVRLVLKKRNSKRLESLVDEKTISLHKKNLVLVDTIAKKDRFLSILSHDLKGPFSSMLGFSTLLNDEFENINHDIQKRYIGLINEGLHNTYKLVENILSWSYSQSGIIEYNPQKEDIYVLINEIIGVMSFSSNQKNICLESKVQESVTAIIDRNMISTILRNIIFNAIKFTPKHGRIEISTEEVEDENKNRFIKFSIKDSGVGMSAESISKLFDLGKTTSTNGTDNEKGTGLGLILCKDFTEKHKGNIWVESEVGKGSTFYFTIPK